jgi:hypothetical protein
MRNQLYLLDKPSFLNWICEFALFSSFGLLFILVMAIIGFISWNVNKVVGKKILARLVVIEPIVK